jgi:shikimate kinase
MTYKNSPRIFVTGYMGAATRELAEKITAELSYELIDMDAEIEKLDGRTIQRICMLMGEHEYRNKEYEALEELSKKEDLVVVCGDGALFDEMCEELMGKGEIVIADADRSAEELWQAAKDDKNIPYAFMQFGSEDEKRETFFKMYDQRKPIYDKYI